ncbi:hypothetical protein FQR65_LT06333 [Abscondita terminalis]|nr:hypothetical protein FQR65_LT06333 [Abscondita terminalis]
MTMKSKRAVVEINEDEDEVSLEEDTNESEEDQGSNNDEDNEEEASANSGWADSIAKILKTSKPKGKKTVVLSKAKKITNVKKLKVKHVDFEVETKDGEIKREEVVESDEDDESEKPIRKKKKELRVLRVKPDILNKDRERLLSKIATRGVVQLFNAVKQQQKDIDSKLKDAGSLEVKRDKVLKGINKKEFLNVLMGGKHVNTDQVKNDSKHVLKNESSEGPTWKVLRDDFMMSAKMKDWDKELDDDVDMKEEDGDST